MKASFPRGAAVTKLRHRVAFHETDAMGVVHHANYLRFFEEARVAWLQQHDRPYTDYIKIGRHFAVTRVQVDYLRSAAFDQQITITIALQWVAGASACFIYEVCRDDELLVRAATEHALIDEQGRPRRIPPGRRERLIALAIQGAR